MWETVDGVEGGCVGVFGPNCLPKTWVVKLCSLAV